MMLGASANLRKILKTLGHLLRLLEIFGRSSVVSKDLWQFQNDFGDHSNFQNDSTGI